METVGLQPSTARAADASAQEIFTSPGRGSTNTGSGFTPMRAARPSSSSRRVVPAPGAMLNACPLAVSAGAAAAFR